MAIEFTADPSAQTPTNKFTPDSTPLASPNDVDYTWDGVKWVAYALDNTADFEDLFVEVAGDNMTGNLTLGTDKIVLNAPGYIDIYRPGQNGNGSIFRCYGDIGGQTKVSTTRLMDGGVFYLGNDLSGDNSTLVDSNARIKLNGMDSSATFVGQINGTTVGTSDARFKENITPAKPQLADVVALGGILKNYDWTDEAPVNEELRSVRQLGLVAQEVEDICPSLVKDINRTKTMEITPAVFNADGEVTVEAVTEEVADKYKGLSQEALIMKLIGAVAELSAEVQALKDAA